MKLRLTRRLLGLGIGSIVSHLSDVTSEYMAHQIRDYTQADWLRQRDLKRAYALKGGGKVDYESAPNQAFARIKSWK